MTMEILRFLMVIFTVLLGGIAVGAAFMSDYWRNKYVELMKDYIARERKRRK